MRERKIAPRIINWVWIAKLVLMSAIVANKTSTKLPIILISLRLSGSNSIKLWIAGSARKVSVKPTMYNAILSAVPIKRVMPMEPPMGKPSERDKI